MEAVYCRTQHMLLSVCGKRWRQVILAMLTVYVDDSGTAKNQPVAIATGLIIPALQITRLEREWDTFKRKEGFSCLHTSELTHHTYGSEFADWNNTKQRRVFDRVVQITRKYGLRCYSVAVNKTDYEAVFPETFRNLVGKHHFTWAVSHLLSILRIQRQEQHSGCPAFEYVIDWMNEGTEERAEVETSLARSEEVAIEDNTPGEFTNYSFRSRKDIPGLQCVDCVSWVAYRFALLAFHDTPIHPLAEVGWQDFGGMTEGGWLKAVAIERREIQRWYEKVLSEPESLDQFKRVEEKRLARRKSDTMTA